MIEQVIDRCALNGSWGEMGQFTSGFLPSKIQKGSSYLEVQTLDILKMKMKLSRSATEIKF